MKKQAFSAKKLALAAMGASLSLLSVTAAFYIKNLSLSFYVLAALGLMLPLSQKYYREAALAFVAVSAIGAIYTTIYILPFVLVTGGYTFFAIIAYEKKIKAVIIYPIAFAYSLFIFWVFYQLTSILYVDLERLNLAKLSPAQLYIVLNAVFSLCFILYHILIVRVYRYLLPLFKKISGNR
ncbi:MAG: hypothetical protein WC292_02275 [Clostridia bacterium]